MATERSSSLEKAACGPLADSGSSALNGHAAGLHLATFTHFFPAHGGGLELVAEHLVREFAARGLSVEWFSSATDPPPQGLPHRVAHRSIPANNIIERLTQLPYPLWSLSALPALWRAIGQADVVHVHEHLYCSSLLALVIARLRHRPIVITQHMGALGLGGKVPTAIYEMAARLLGRAAFSAAARAVFISENVCNFFHREGSAKTCLIFNGIDTNRFRAISASERTALRTTLEFPPDRRVVLFVGRFVRKKGFGLFAPLTRQFPDVLWVFIGSGPEDPTRWRHSNVRVVGRVGHDRLSCYYQAADLLLLPSSGEGFPLVVQEALACGLGVLSTEEVGSACCAARPMIRTCPTPRINVDLDTWVRALQTTLADHAYLGARDVRSHQAHALWSWDYCASEYVRVFEEITRQAQRR